MPHHPHTTPPSATRTPLWRPTLLLAALLAALAGLPAMAAEPAPAAAPPAAISAAPNTLSLPDGGHYQGPLQGGKLHGQGRIDWNGERNYVGQFVNGYMDGYGVLNGPTSRYEGQFKQGQFDGKGKASRGEDYAYEGDFVQGRMEGQGKMTYPGGYSFEGTFKGDKPAGKGRLTDGEGNVVEGDFDEFTPKGPVVMTSANGDRYEGPVQNQMPHGGEGVFTRADKAVVRGKFEYGSIEGKATITYPDGAVYTGQSVNQQAFGEGELRRANGDVYRGAFMADQFYGPGTLTLADGSVQTGTWRAGVLPKTPNDGTLPDTPELAARNNQAVLYNQPALLQAQFDQLQASTPGAAAQPPRIYALYVAGDGSQEVFRREVAFVDEQFAQRFGTRGRSVSLVNSRSSTDKLPLATAHSIELALQALASKMDRQRDLLFVYLTSHGSDTHQLSLGMNRMDLPDLPAARLGQLLKDSGIRNQVVVVSACYSGGFVPALRGDRTWVITAARADRTSFGCADDNEFTYFGRALFKDAMAEATTLSGAFAQATKLVDEWEARDEEKARTAATATERGGRRGAAAPKLNRSEPMSIVSPAFQAEVDRLWRASAPGTTALRPALPAK
ncbi:MAG: hypothetical protein KA914_09845 [Ottowia sp.]|nr:hypothetical protein [Ottowia sp.]